MSRGSGDLDYPFSIGTILIEKKFEIDRVMPSKSLKKKLKTHDQPRQNPKNSTRIQGTQKSTNASDPSIRDFNERGNP